MEEQDLSINWHEYFIYDENAGSCLTRSVFKKFVKKTLDVGCLDTHGYWVTTFNGKHYKCHRIIWEMFNGKIPSGMQIDHVDGNRSNNTISNLRCVEKIINSRNTVKHRNKNTLKTGVITTKKKNRYGTVYFYWTAIWVENGKKYRKCFSKNKFGSEHAFELASNYRDAMIAKLNEHGAGYTERHGK